MRFAEDLVAGRCPIALEITPPQRSRPPVLLRRARLLGGSASVINVIERPDRQSSLQASLELVAAGMQPAWHVAAHGLSRQQLLSDLAEARSAGIGQVLCLLGDQAKRTGAGAGAGSGSGSGELTIKEAIGMARTALPGALIGATLNQHARDRERALANLLPKLAAGASFIQTQPVFDADVLESWLEPIRRAAPDAKVVAMVMPLLSSEAAWRIEQRLGFAVPQWLHDELAGGAEAAWAAFDRILDVLVRRRIADGLAVMTFEMDAEPETGRRIVAALNRAREASAA